MSRAWKWLRYNGVSIWAALAIAYLLVPIALIAVFSFNDPSGKFNYTWSGFTTYHWTHAFSIPELNDAFLTSIRLAALSTLIATALGTMIAIALVRHNFRGRKVANFLIVIPMATPEVVIGASLLSMFLIYGISLGFFSLLLAHVMFSISFVVIIVRSRLIGFDRRLEEASRDLGAPPLTTFRTITLPLLTPGLIGAALLAFALSIDDFVISNFTSGTTVTFPLYIFGAAQRGIPVEVYVIATMLFMVTVVAMAFVTWQQFRAEKLASIRPDDDEDTGLPALASGQDPLSAAGTAS
jgi:spermidine/putrescine transport system permease protein